MDNQSAINSTFTSLQVMFYCQLSFCENLKGKISSFQGFWDLEWWTLSPSKHEAQGTHKSINELKKAKSTIYLGCYCKICDGL